ncbi:hypothetical protein [Microbispora sp. NPDC049125]|uniref:hypothetical protein n=1 Tax=Microbispora sp. NPDC049125 TaxID=3154929 RepID=UPI0034670A2C
MSIIRRGRMMADEIGSQYTSIANQVFRDWRLSADAKAVFGLISTHQNGYNITAESLCAKFNKNGLGMKEGLSTVKKALRELEEHGYLVRVRLRNEDGTLGGTCYEITDMPDGFNISAPPPYGGNPSQEPAVESPAVEIQPQVSEERLPRSQPTVKSPPLVEPTEAEPPVVTQPDSKKNNYEKNISLPPSEVERDARASARSREDTPQVGPESAVPDLFAAVLGEGGPPADPAVDDQGPPTSADDDRRQDRRQRATRLPEDWEPGQQARAWAAKRRYSQAFIDHETEKFRRHFKAVPGEKGRKIDWDATWENWLIRAEERSPGAARAAEAAADPEKAAQAAKITGWWWNGWSARGPILSGNRDDLYNLVFMALTNPGSPATPETVCQALIALDDPVPHPKALQRVLGAPPQSGLPALTGGGRVPGPRPSTTDQRVAQALSVAEQMRVLDEAEAAGQLGGAA